MQADFKEIQNYFSQAIESYCSGHSQNKENKGTYMEILRQKCRIHQLPKMISSSIQNGLPESKVEQNKKMYGQNRFLRRKIKTLGEIFREVICDQTLIILIIAAVVSIVVQYFFGEDKSRFWVDGVSILAAVVICSIVGTISNYQKEQQFADLDQMTELTFNYDVIRDGKRIELHRNQVVAGDMIMINSGMEVPADCLLYKAIDIIVDQSAITGESVELLKNTIDKCNPNGKEDSPIMISGSTVISGEGLMMPIVVGRNSHNGKNFQMIFSQDQEEQKTPLQEKLEDMAEKIGYMGLIAGIAIILILLIRLAISDILTEGFSFQRDIPQVVKAFIIGIVVLVAAIPQGLPLAVTLTLAFSMKQMHQENILVRKLISCETMGSAHIICTDKTGTITENKMQVREVLNFDRIYKSKELNKQSFNRKYLDLLIKTICHNSSAILEPMVKGPQTQIALLKFIQSQADINVEKVRKQINQQNIFLRLPFNSMRKRMTTGIIDGKNYILTSGASQRILQVCKKVRKIDGESEKISENSKGKLKELINKMSNEGLRVVGLAYKQLDSSKTRSSEIQSKDRGEIQSIQKDDFTLLGFFGIEDQPRPESKQSIQKALKASIEVIMITGDNSLTASKIAREVGIIRPNFEEVIEGAQLIDRLEKKGLLRFSQSKQQQNQDIKKIKKVMLETEEDKQKFDEIVQGLAVMSRSRPQHKYVLVDALIKRGNVVAVTGDGSNDAPALKRASIGLAMGQIGTQSAKNASDIVVLDDRFDSIVRAIVWGRNVFNSIRRFLQFQLTINLFLIFITLLSSVLIRQSVFNAVQILWFNLIMDSLAALALAAEPPNEEELLAQPPNSKDESLLTPTMIKHIIGQSIFQLVIVVLLLFLGPQFLPEYADEYDAIIGKDLQAKYFNGQPEGTVQDGKMYEISGEDNYKVYFDKYHVYSRHLTIIFNTVVFLQVFNFFCCRKVKDQLNLLKDVCSSLIFWLMVIAIIVVQVIAIEYISVFFGLYAYGLTIQQWGISIALGTLGIFMSFFLRFLCIAKPPTNQQEKQKMRKGKK